MPFAVKTAAVAIPLLFDVAVFTPPANVPLAPLAGAVNVTTDPLTGLPKASLTVVPRLVEKTELIPALCGVPAVAATDAAAAAETEMLPEVPAIPPFVVSAEVTV